MVEALLILVVLLMILLVRDNRKFYRQAIQVSNETSSRPTGIDGVIFKPGDRVVVLAGFNPGAHGVVEYQEPSGRCWVLRDKASSPVWYLPRELRLERKEAVRFSLDGEEDLS